MLRHKRTKRLEIVFELVWWANDAEKLVQATLNDKYRSTQGETEIDRTHWRLLNLWCKIMILQQNVHVPISPKSRKSWIHSGMVVPSRNGFEWTLCNLLNYRPMQAAKCSCFNQAITASTSLVVIERSLTCLAFLLQIGCWCCSTVNTASVYSKKLVQHFEANIRQI